MGKTSIEWTEYSWNPLRGVKGNWHCTKVSPGCANCYAERVNRRFGGPSYTIVSDTIRLDEKVLMEPLRWRKPHMVFVCSMTDLFHEGVDWSFQYKIFHVMMRSSRHTFQVLTKRPERALEFLKEFGPDAPRLPAGELRWPLDNVWLGVSVENQQTADKRIPILLQIPAAVRWVSAEPLLGPIDLSAVPLPTDAIAGRRPMLIDWLVCGGESGPGARPFDPEWGRDLLRQCRAAGVPFFGKQWDKKRELPNDLMVREMPTHEGGGE